MKIIMGADSGGFELKQAIKQALIARGYDVTDFNPDGPVLYQIEAEAVAKGVQNGEYDRGIAICGTGMGVSIICNKHQGVYAALVESVYTARRSKVINNTNVLAMGGMVVGPQMGVEMALAWLEAEHLQGLDDEARKNVGNEFNDLVKVEERCY